eukprot:479965-Pleurochrysis_carterae.AAC.3
MASDDGKCSSRLVCPEREESKEERPQSRWADCRSCSRSRTSIHTWQRLPQPDIGSRTQVCITCRQP